MKNMMMVLLVFVAVQSVAQNTYNVKSVLDQFEGIKLATKKVQEENQWSDAKTKEVEREYKRWLIMLKELPCETLPMISRDVDAIWHQHILFTKAYRKETQGFFGYFLDHEPTVFPTEASALEEFKQKSSVRVKFFLEEYLKIFGEAVPSLWFDRQPMVEISEQVPYTAHVPVCAPRCASEGCSACTTYSTEEVHWETVTKVVPQCQISPTGYAEKRDSLQD